MECRAFEDGRCTRFESPYIGELCPVAEHKELCVMAYRDACGGCSHEKDSQPTACMFCIRCYAHEPDRYEKTVKSHGIHYG